MTTRTPHELAVEFVSKHGINAPYQVTDANVAEIELTIQQALRAQKPVDVDTIKRNVLGDDNRSCHLGYAEKEHWSRFIDHLSTKYNLTEKI